jgi:cytochrome c oxidase subunit 3
MSRVATLGGVRPSPRRPAPAPLVSNAQLAMVAVIVGEVMMFAGLVGAYIVFRLSAPVWPPAGLPRLPILLTALNTLVLVASVLPMRAAVAHVRGDRPEVAGRAATAAAVLGALFVGVQGAEWVRLVRHGLTLGSGAYGGAFYVLIGCHAVHVLVAILLLVTVAALVRRGRVDARRPVPLEACATYWYFVVVLWLGLFPLVYLY